MGLLKAIEKKGNNWQQEEWESLEEGGEKQKGKRANGEEGGASSTSKKARGGAGSSGSGGGKQVASIRKNPELKGLLTLMIKAALRSEQKHREAEGVIFDSFLGPADCGTVLGGTEQSTTYADQVRGNKGHGMGPPYTYVFLGILSAIVMKLSEKIGQATLNKLKDWYGQLEPMPWQEVCDVVLMCRISKTFDKEKRRLTMALAPHLVEEKRALAKAMDELGWERKYGRAPPSHMERELQEFLTSLVKD